MKTYDVIVIGTGGGMVFAAAAAEAGRHVAVIEEDAVGGTCLNRGCIPSKMLIYPAEIPEAVEQFKKIDVQIPGVPHIDFGAVMRRTSGAVQGMSERLADRLRDLESLDFYRGSARFVSDKIIQVGDDKLTAETILIATGSRPAIPDIPGLAGTPYMTSREALSRCDLPASMAVLGAGYIAVELGAAYAGFGTDVSFIVRSRFLRNEDREISDEFERLFSAAHQVHKGFVLRRVEHDGSLFALHLEDEDGLEKTIKVEALLVATGVRPNSDQLGLEHTGIERDEKGYIGVDEYLQTAVPGVWAMGDVIGKYLFRHTVNFEARYLIRLILENGPSEELVYSPVPHAVFGDPEIAGVGVTEQELQAAGVQYVAGTADYIDGNAALARGYSHGFVKVLAEQGTGRLLGVHILGPEASNMIHIFIAMMVKAGTVEDILNMIFIHPALPEVARDAVRAVAAKL